MRAAILAVALAACTADIQSGTYLCGPQGQCPPGQACDPTSTRCVLPEQVEPFTCTAGQPMGPLQCAGNASTLDCLMNADTRLHYTVTTPTTCDETMTVKALFPVGLMPLQITVRDAAQAVVATSMPCGTDVNGTSTACLSFAATRSTTYDLEVGGAMPIEDCGGNCPFNRFLLSVVYGGP